MEEWKKPKEKKEIKIEAKEEKERTDVSQLHTRCNALETDNTSRMFELGPER